MGTMSEKRPTRSFAAARSASPRSAAVDWSQFARDASSLAAARVSALFEFFVPRKASDARPVGRPRAASPGRESFFSRESRRR